MYGCWLGHSGRTDKENQSSTVLGTLPLGNIKDPDPHQIVGSGSVPKWKVGSRSVSKWYGSATLLSPDSANTHISYVLRTRQIHLVSFYALGEYVQFYYRHYATRPEIRHVTRMATKAWNFHFDIALQKIVNCQIPRRSIEFEYLPQNWIHRLNLERLNLERLNPEWTEPRMDWTPTGPNPQWDWTPTGLNPDWDSTPTELNPEWDSTPTGLNPDWDSTPNGTVLSEWDWIPIGTQPRI